MLRRTVSIPLLALLALAALARARPAAADDDDAAVPPLACAALATDPAGGLAGAPGVKSATSALVPAAGTNVSHCQVNVLYGTSADQNIHIRVGLPLSSLDGGAGGVQGAWNGRTQGVGGGGCAGNLNVTAPVNAGYVGSGTDLGHAGGNCEPGVNPDGTYDLGFIQDFIRNAIEEQVLLSKAIARRYYGREPAYNYWNGCSTGGRQGYLLAQELPGELDGILANAPAIYWTRFQTAQMWGQIAMRELVGGPIATAKLAQASASAVAACDAADGVADGVIDDPRTCHFSAAANVCGLPTAPSTSCLTPAEAAAIDAIWDGPRNGKGERIWFPLDRGTNLAGLNGPTPFALGVTQLHWDEHDRAFDWTTVAPGGYAQVAQDGSRNIADVTDTFGDLDRFRRGGGKLLTFVGGNDQLIMPRGVIHYYRHQALLLGEGDRPDFARLQQFYRLFRAPGVGHCGGGAGPQPQNLFAALVDWVENGVAPDRVLAQNPATGTPTRTRPLCPYPATAIWDGVYDPNLATSFSCGGDLERTPIVCADVLARYKHEVKGPLDFRGDGVTPAACAGRGEDED